ncbi:MAG: putative cation/proton antiporter YbaL [bacterium]|nr:putative cation/proton antiporter YbaL [bacterium]
MEHLWIKDLLVILLAGFAAGAICKRLGVSLLVGYLVVGALIGPGALGWVHDDSNQIESFATVGVLLLLFSVGLEFTLEDFGKILRPLLVGGSVFTVGCAIPAYATLRWLGLPSSAALLLAVAFSFSSTVLVYKALAEWGQVATPHGTRAMGIVVFQDIAMVPFLLFIPLLAGAGDAPAAMALLKLLVTSAVLVLSVFGLRWTVGRWLVGMLVDFKSPELVVLFTLVVIAGTAFVSHLLGLPPPLGAFLAGMVLSGNRLTSQIDALALPFRESFSAVFFISLGLLLDPGIYIREWRGLLPLLIATLALKTLVGAASMRVTGVSWKAGLGMGLGISQLGEFSFVLALEGVRSGILSADAYGWFLAVAIGSLVVTPQLLKVGLGWTALSKEKDREGHVPVRTLPPDIHDAVVIGVGPIGRKVFSKLEVDGFDMALIDMSPVNLHPFAQQGFRTIAGDARNEEILRRAEVNECELIVVCVPDDPIAIQVIKAVRLLNPKAPILARCRYMGNANLLRAAGATEVVVDERETTTAIIRALSRVEEPD